MLTRYCVAWVEPEELHEIRRGDNEEYPVQDQLNGQDGVDGFQVRTEFITSAETILTNVFRRLSNSLQEVPTSHGLTCLNVSSSL